MNISEDTFNTWSQSPSKTEADQCENAETAVRKAIAADEKLAAMNITVFAQGSYSTRTNVRQDSDVDITVRHNTTVFPEYPAGKTGSDFGLGPAAITFKDFKGMVGDALINYFGSEGVTRGNKAFDVHENTYRIDADVVAALEYRHYTGRFNSNGTHNYLAGVAFDPDTGARIVNWPEQNYTNGVARNDVTGRQYKRIIRILKRLRNKMQDEKVVEATNIASFLIECLVWNAPLEAFEHDTYTAIIKHVIADVWDRTQKDEDCKEWREVNKLKYLFWPAQPWTREQANKFLLAVWNYIGYK